MSAHDSGEQPDSPAASLIAQQFACRIVNEMRFGAGQANYRRIPIFCILWRLRQKMLHVHPRLGTPKYDVAGHAWQFAKGG